eukprot:TRINITY_DN44789_c0_g2_i1.p1 TRINITY_DN44789_c0_g2~~TRINITY_DN44789_c0_g2_i1.p1  ORF type:complete len:527 (+),score=93.85 TRINITY_DN44789_c0_g2_i1:92-1672(+)
MHVASSDAAAGQNEHEHLVVGSRDIEAAGDDSGSPPGADDAEAEPAGLQTQGCSGQGNERQPKRTRRRKRQAPDDADAALIKSLPGWCTLLGLAGFLAALTMVAGLERLTVCTQQAHGAALAAHEDVECEADGKEIEDGSLVHFSCPVSESSLTLWSSSSLPGKARLAGAFAVKAVKLRQEVQMYQCLESMQSPAHVPRLINHTSQGSSAKYAMAWSATWVDSRGFAAWQDVHAQNALRSACGAGFQGNPAMALQSQTLSPAVLVAGPFDVTQHLSALAADTAVKIAPGAYDLPSSGSGETIEVVERTGNVLATCHLARPAVGCLKMSFWRSSATHLSVLAALNRTSSKASPWKTSAWPAPRHWMCQEGGGEAAERSSSSLDLLVEGDHEAHEMIWELEAAHPTHIWVARTMGSLLAASAAFLCLYSMEPFSQSMHKRCPPRCWLLLPLDSLADVAAGSNWWQLALVAIGVALPSICMLAVAVWSMVRPIPGMSTLLAACAGILGLTVQKMATRAEEGRKRRGKSE